MLYEAWRKVAGEFAGAVALVDAASGRQWTFHELSDIAEQGTVREDIVFPAGSGPEFIFQLLWAWKHRKVTCPIDCGHVPPAIHAAPPRGIVHFKTTSATGGKARLVAFRAEQLAADAANIVHAMGLRRDWPNLAVISLAHSYGFSNLVLPLLLHGIPLILVRTALPESLKRASESWAAVTLPAVPALWKMWGEASAIPENTRLAISAGAPLPLAVEQMVFEHFGLKIHNFYGSTECGGIAYDGTPCPRKDGSHVGNVLTNVRVGVGESGCIEVRGRAVGETYWPEPGGQLGRGVFRTSDLGQVQNGSVFLKGRLGDLINVAGRKIAPEIIEQALASHPGVKECVVFGVPLDDGHRGESIVGCLSTHAGTTVENLRQFAGAKLPAWQIPREWWFMDALPTNGRGKVSRTELRNRYLTQRA